MLPGKKFEPAVKPLTSQLWARGEHGLEGTHMDLWPIPRVFMTHLSLVLSRVLGPLKPSWGFEKQLFMLKVDVGTR